MIKERLMLKDVSNYSIGQVITKDGKNYEIIDKYEWQKHESAYGYYGYELKPSDSLSKKSTDEKL